MDDLTSDINFVNRTRVGTITQLCADDDLETRKKKFLFQVIETLHSAGNLSYKVYFGIPYKFVQIFVGYVFTNNIYVYISFVYIYYRRINPL
jgi:hypothetical protein